MDTPTPFNAPLLEEMRDFDAPAQLNNEEASAYTQAYNAAVAEANQVIQQLFDLLQQRDVTIFQLTLDQQTTQQQHEKANRPK